MENKDKNWLIKFSLAKKYFESNGNLLIPINYETENGIKLGRWISKQRQYYKNKDTYKANSSFTQERIERLECIGMIWSTKKEVA